MPGKILRWSLRSLQRKTSAILLLICLVALALVIWTIGFHTSVSTDFMKVSVQRLKRAEQDNVIPRPKQAEDKDSIHNCFLHFSGSINISDTVFKHMFRSIDPQMDSQLIEYSNYFQPRPTIVNPLMKNYIIEPTDICKGTGNAPYILIMIPSVSTHTALRKVIRNTWGSVVHKPWPGTKDLLPVKIVFVFGKSEAEGEDLILKNESRQHGDVLYVDFADTYRNLTYKSVSSLHWASTRCPKAEFFMKVDEDTFVNVPYLVQFLRYHQRELHRSVLGHAIPRPVSVRTGRWAVSESAYPLPLFPRYLFGHSYVISKDLLPDLVNVSRHMPFIPVEDAFVTGILARTLNASRLHNSMFAMEKRSFTCSVVKHTKLTVTLLSDSSHRMLWEAVTSGNCSYQFLPRPKKKRPEDNNIAAL